MVKIIIIGRSGRMGKLIETVSHEKGYTVVGGVNSTENVFKTNILYDVIIDFSLPEVFNQHYMDIKNSKKPYICGVTGMSEHEMNKLKDLGKTNCVVYSSNFSIGIQLMIKALHEVNKSIPENTQIEIIEKHHKMKLDKPSGTAVSLAKELEISKNNKYEFNSPIIHSLRGGQIVGDHSVQFMLENEVLEINHRALDRKIFAEGAVYAVQNIINKEKGFYTFSELLEG